MNVVKRCKQGLMIYNRKDVWQGKSFETYGEYSEEEVRLYSKIVNKSHTVIEIGANIGSLMVPLARLAGTVMSFEPERTAFYALAGNVAINNLRNVFCFQQAFGKEVGRVNVPELNIDATENFGGLELDKDYSQGPCYLVAMNTVDNLNLEKCDLIKIDVEGMELLVLEGAVQTLDKFGPILIVEDDRPQKSDALREFIKSKGYRAYAHCAPFFNPSNWNGVKINVFSTTASFNLFCHKQLIDFDPVAEFGMVEV